MNFIKLILFLFLLWLPLRVYSQSSNKIEITYMGFRYYTLASKENNYLSLLLRNKSDDTLYISRRNILLDVFEQNGNRLTEKKIDSFVLQCGTPFLYLDDPYGLNKKSPQEQILDGLKYDYVRKMFRAKFEDGLFNKERQEYIMRSTSFDIIILMPKEMIYHDIVFRSEEFDKSCRVYATYQDKDIFSSFLPK